MVGDPPGGSADGRYGPLAEALASANGFVVFYPGDRGAFWRLRNPDVIPYAVAGPGAAGQVSLSFDDPHGRRLSVISSPGETRRTPPGEKPWNVGDEVVYLAAEGGDEVYARIERAGSQALVVVDHGYIAVDELITFATTLVPAS